MGLIKTNYDLAGGPAFTDEILLPSTWRYKGIPSGCPITQVVTLETWIDTENGGYERLTDGNDVPIRKKIYGDTAGSVNPIIINATKGKVKIIPPKDANGNYIGKGTISVDSYNN